MRRNWQNNRYTTPRTLKPSATEYGGTSQGVTKTCIFVTVEDVDFDNPYTSFGRLGSSSRGYHPSSCRNRTFH